MRNHQIEMISLEELVPKTHNYRKFVELFNKSAKQYLQFPLKLNWEKKSEFIYIGSNLQVGDDIGICFVYPFILWYELFYNS